MSTVGVDCEGEDLHPGTCLDMQRGERRLFLGLRQLLAGGNNKPPQVHDQSGTGMKSALKFVLTGAHIVTCLWHVSKSLERAAGARRKQEAKKRFTCPRKNLTIHEFDGERKLLLQVAPLGSSLNSNISRLRGRTVMWARHVVGYVFTAGSVTTQRVEKAHSLLKNNLHTKSTLDDVLVMTEERTIKENLNREELCYRREPPHSRWRINSTMDDFHGIVAKNNKFLGGFTRFKIVDEMTESYFYRVMESDLTDLKVTE